MDTGRAAREMPGGRTIAHGLLLLSLIPTLQRQIFHVRRRGHGLNYGYDRVRFVRPVACDARVRLAQTMVEARPDDDGTPLTLALADAGPWTGRTYPYLDVYEEIARISERGVDMLFFGDGTGIPDTWRGSRDEAVRWGMAGRVTT